MGSASTWVVHYRQTADEADLIAEEAWNGRPFPAAEKAGDAGASSVHRANLVGQWRAPSKGRPSRVDIAPSTPCTGLVQ
jgi:hypothetical protein